MGLDVLEKPFITFDDETVLKTNMTIGLHAILGSSTVPMYVQIADTYIITDGEPRILSKIPKEIKVL
jgi:Xaa-Pro aminopeptidase